MDFVRQKLWIVSGSLGGPQFVIYGHVHRPFIRMVPGLTVANCGSVSLSYDDPRASYLVLDDGKATIRRVEYDVELEVRGLLASGYPYASWLARILQTGRYQSRSVNERLGT